MPRRTYNIPKPIDVWVQGQAETEDISWTQFVIGILKKEKDFREKVSLTTSKKKE